MKYIIMVSLLFLVGCGDNLADELLDMKRGETREATLNYGFRWNPKQRDYVIYSVKDDEELLRMRRKSPLTFIPTKLWEDICEQYRVNK